MVATKSEKVPKAMASIFAEVTTATDAFCRQHLDADYAELARRAAAALCRKRPSPLTSGHPRTWACAVLYALGQVNFLSDKSFEPYMLLADLCARFGVGASTGGNKAKVVRDALGMNRMNFQWVLPRLVKQNPLAFMLSIDGFLVDARTLPIEMQELAVAAGLIPCVVPPSEPDRKGKRKSGGPKAVEQGPRLVVGPSVAIDDREQADRLVRALEENLPLLASATPALVRSLRDIFRTADIPLEWQITQVEYAGDEGGIMCRLMHCLGDDADDDGEVVHVSITHLVFDESTPCAREIAAYQKHRVERLRLAAA